jgi:heme-degrading monooxygenase HmoA
MAPRLAGAPHPRLTRPNLAEAAMVYEMARIEVIPGKESEFEAGVRQALPLFDRARGCHGAELHRTIEHPNQFLLLVQWDTVEDHMVHFRESADFTEWRKLVGPYFAQAPVVTHTEITVE